MGCSPFAGRVIDSFQIYHTIPVDIASADMKLSLSLSVSLSVNVYVYRYKKDVSYQIGLPDREMRLLRV